MSLNLPGLIMRLALGITLGFCLLGCPTGGGGSGNSCHSTAKRVVECFFLEGSQSQSASFDPNTASNQKKLSDAIAELEADCLKATNGSSSNSYSSLSENLECSRKASSCAVVRHCFD